jgi:hypothetical protein
MKEANMMMYFLFMYENKRIKPVESVLREDEGER